MQKRNGIFIFLLALVLFIPAVQGITWVNRCINDTHLFKTTASLTVNGQSLQMNETEPCRYGCDLNKDECMQPFLMTSTETNTALWLYGGLFVFGLASLIIGVTQKKLILTFLGTILFLVLTFLSISFEQVFQSTPFSGLTGVFIGLTLLLTLAGFILSLIGFVDLLRDEGELTA